MKNELFSSRLYRNGLRQLRVSGIVLLILSAACTALPALLTLITTKQREQLYGVGQIPFTSVGNITLLFALMMYLAPIVLCMVLFSFLNRRNGSDTYHSFPVGRVCLFSSLTLAVLTWVVVILFVPLLITVLFYLASGVAVNGVTIPLIALTYFTGALLITAEFLLAMSVTGTVLTNLAVFGLILFLPRFITTLFSYMVMSNLRMITINDLGIFGNININIPVKFFLSVPLGKLSFGIGQGEALYTSVPAIVYTLVLALIYMVLGCLLFLHRKSETAGRSAPNRIMQHVFRCAITLPVSLIIPLAMFDHNYTADRIGNIGFLVIIAVATLFIYFFYELITTKKLKNLLTAAPIFLVVVLADVIFGTAYCSARNNALNFKPSAADIDSVTLLTDTSRIGLQNINPYNQLMIKQTRLTDPALRQKVSDILKENIESYKEGVGISANYSFQLHLKSGRMVERNIAPSNQESSSFNELLIQNPNFHNVLYSLPPLKNISEVSVGDLSRENSLKVWKLYEKEFNALTDQQKSELLNIPSYNSNSGNFSYSNNDIGSSFLDNCAIQGFYGVNSFSGSYQLSIILPQTASLYAQLENEATQQDFKDFIQSVAQKKKGCSFNLQLINASADTDFADSAQNGGASKENNDTYYVNEDNDKTAKNSKQETAVLDVLEKYIGKPADLSEPFLSIDFENGNGQRYRSYYMNVSLDDFRAILNLSRGTVS